MNKDITIVVPSYNHAKYLPNLLQRLKELITTGVYVYIIDDCSTDNSRELITKFKDDISNDNVTVVFKDKNKGLVDSLNQALVFTKTELFYIISSDDMIDPNGFIQSINYINKNPNMDFYIFGAL
ncbi:glycosyltransferase family 2 protein, partial [Escherichia coli]|nr:glycosyltransferase family 2 protein [Escherichia coli]